MQACTLKLFKFFVSYIRWYQTPNFLPEVTKFCNIISMALQRIINESWLKHQWNVNVSEISTLGQITGLYCLHRNHQCFINVASMSHRCRFNEQACFLWRLPCYQSVPDWVISHHEISFLRACLFVYTKSYGRLYRVDLHETQPSALDTSILVPTIRRHAIRRLVRRQWIRIHFQIFFTQVPIGPCGAVTKLGLHEATLTPTGEFGIVTSMSAP